jgi:hypothetical protein
MSPASPSGTANSTGKPPSASSIPRTSPPRPDWAAAARTRRDQGRPAGRWVAAQPEGNRNSGLFWAANRALEDNQAADLSPLAAAARQAGLTDPEITRTLQSARCTSQARPEPRDREAEGTS